jgi:hypothetical protein
LAKSRQHGLLFKGPGNYFGKYGLVSFKSSEKRIDADVLDIKMDL